ncbi:hypothetical protein GP476_00175 (plasmid) [Aeromonas dhakensis]|uniref:hypothetical protein n=1 Tax=Aeromonas dhakensis TaxID=196024 RepID=UPI0021B4079F|nr:hypothetical protein [Aeromonas dhakensis]UXB09966.1 hypothetical protein GP476_00175 [Aeromonas dhakensis]
MKKKLVIAIAISLSVHTSAYAINAKYRQQLERSGCTQASEAQGCDITKTKEENAKMGFDTGIPAEKAKTSNQTPYAGQWVAVGPTGGTVATIRIDAKERVWVNGKPVKAKRSDGALVFHQGVITYTIQGDRRLKEEDVWHSSDAGTSGKIASE